MSQVGACDCMTVLMFVDTPGVSLSLVHETVAQLALLLPFNRAEAEYIVGQFQWTEDPGPLSLTGLLAGEDDVVYELCGERVSRMADDSACGKYSCFVLAERVVLGPWWTEMVEAMGAGKLYSSRTRKRYVG